MYFRLMDLDRGDAAHHPNPAKDPDGGGGGEGP